MKRKMSNLRKNREIWLIFLIAILFSWYLSGNEIFIVKYISNGLSSILLPVFGVLLGSLITAYTLILAFRDKIPRNIRETNAYKRTNLHFLLTLLTIWIVIITSLLSYFMDGRIIIMANLFLSIFSFLMFFYLIIVIYQLIRIINNRD